MSSPVLTTTVTSAGWTTRTSPRRNFPAPIPPASAVTRIADSVVGSLAMAEATPQRTRSDPSSLPPRALTRRALSRAEAGKALSVDEAAGLIAARGQDLDRLMLVASGLRELGHGSTITYSRKVFIPLTMLCRDHCHYCTFAKPPAKLERPFLSLEEVVAIAEAGRALGCKEALFTLGDRPEGRYPVAREWLAERGYHSTLDYVRAAAIRVIEETGLLPHLNPGVMSWEEMARLKHVSASMGLMLETSSERLLEKGGAHFGSPDKVPAVRMRTIEDAGRPARRGLELRERLTIYPEFALRPDPFLTAKMRRPVEELMGVDGLAARDTAAHPIAWQDPDVQWKPRSIELTFAKGPGAELRQDAAVVYGDFEVLDNEVSRSWAGREVVPARIDADGKAALRKAARHRPIPDTRAP